MAGNDFNGYGGLAWVGTLCMFKAESCSITEKMGNIVYTAEVSSTYLELFDFLNTYLYYCPTGQNRVGALIYIISGRGRKCSEHICIFFGRGRKSVGAPTSWAPNMIIVYKRKF